MNAVFVYMIGFFMGFAISSYIDCLTRNDESVLYDLIAEKLDEILNHCKNYDQEKRKEIKKKVVDVCSEVKKFKE